jgi:hypothetical protein
MDSRDVSFKALLLRTTVWAEMQARLILEKGRGLDEQETALARRAGVRYPGEVLLLVVASLPIPEENDLKEALREFALVKQDTKGLTIGYNIFLLQGWLSEALLAHQLVKVAQCEGCEGIPNFFTKYVSEILRYGYPNAPMEQEAITFARDFAGFASMRSKFHPLGQGWRLIRDLW